MKRRTNPRWSHASTDYASLSLHTKNTAPLFFYRYTKNCFAIFVLFLTLLINASCRTVNALSVAGAEEAGLYDILEEGAPVEQYTPPDAADSRAIPSHSPDALTDSSNSGELGNQCYLFIRLYDPVYKNPFYMSTLLKGGIAVTEVHPLKLSHASIGLDLTDNFFGLTLMPRPMLNEEHACDVSTNEFMVQCKMDKSSQTTFVLPVTVEEYERTKRVLYQYRDANYSSGKVVRAALKAIWRKMHRKKNRTLEVALFTKKGTAAVAKQMDKKRKFSCSAFVAFVLYNSVDSITQYFDKCSTNLNYISVTDLAYLPGVKPLFSSSWQDYNKAAQTYVDEHQEFMPFASRDK